MDIVDPRTHEIFHDRPFRSEVVFRWHKDDRTPSDVEFLRTAYRNGDDFDVERADALPGRAAVTEVSESIDGTDFRIAKFVLSYIRIGAAETT